MSEVHLGINVRSPHFEETGLLWSPHFEETRRTQAELDRRSFFFFVTPTPRVE